MSHRAGIPSRPPGWWVSAAADDTCLGPLIRSLPDARAVADALTAMTYTTLAATATAARISAT